MRKINNNNNNKFRGNAVYSLNYKFDSISVAGKFSGTALDLIKKYNELAKEAHSNGNYVEMEVFRQYAEHYRKIVTEINERKNQQREAQNEQNADNNANSENTEENAPAKDAENGAADADVNKAEKVEKAENKTAETSVENEAKTCSDKETAESKTEAQPRRRRSFTVVDVSKKENEKAAAESKPRTRRCTRAKADTETKPAE